MYDFRIVQPRTFLRDVAGSDHDFTVDELIDAMRSRIVSAFSDAVAAAKIPVLQIASRYREIGEALLPVINPAIISKYGLELSSFIVENVSVPAEVEQAIDKRSSMAAVGDLNAYVKYQMAQGMDKGGGPRARRPSSPSAFPWRNKCCGAGGVGAADCWRRPMLLAVSACRSTMCSQSSNRGAARQK